MEIANPGRVKITEIHESRKRTKRVRDSDGKERTEEYEFYGVRDVQVVQGLDRFWHYLIDALILMVIGAGIGVALALTGLYLPQSNGFMGFSYSNGEFAFNFIGFGVNFFFYFFFEMITASTPGKMLLGRVVVNEYGEKPEAPTVALRSVCRLIPFEAFSCLSERGWHDTLSRTFVVSKAERDKLLELRRQQEIANVQKLSDDYHQKSAIS